MEFLVPDGGRLVRLQHSVGFGSDFVAFTAVFPKGKMKNVKDFEEFVRWFEHQLDDLAQTRLGSDATDVYTLYF